MAMIMIILHTSSVSFYPQATDIDTGAFGTVQYEFPVDQSQFSIDGEDGTIRLVQVFNATADDKYNVVPVTAFDNPDNRQLSFSTPSTVRVSRSKYCKYDTKYNPDTPI